MVCSRVVTSGCDLQLHALLQSVALQPHKELLVISGFFKKYHGQFGADRILGWLKWVLLSANISMILVLLAHFLMFY